MYFLILFIIIITTTTTIKFIIDLRFIKKNLYFIIKVVPKLIANIIKLAIIRPTHSNFVQFFSLFLKLYFSIFQLKNPTYRQHIH